MFWMMEGFVELKDEAYREFLRGKLAFRKGEFEGEGYGFVRVRYKGKRIGYGYYNKRDKYPLRIYSLEKEDFREALLENIKKAKKFREGLGFKDVYRLVYSDADWLPGLIIDRYKDLFVMVYNSFLYSKNRSLISEVLLEIFGEISLYDKIKERFVVGEKREAIIEEDGVRFIVRVDGQKTGFYLDQRENRILFRKFLSGDEEVLDAFCYSGGFGMHALKKGCEVTFLEKSGRAVELLKKNLELNGFSARIIKKDFFRWKGKKKYDVVLADPPNYSEFMSREVAYKNYFIIAKKCLGISKEIFVYSICDPNVDVSNAISLVQKASKELGKDARVFMITFQSRDHPVTHPGLLYLKTLWIKL